MNALSWMDAHGRELAHGLASLRAQTDQVELWAIELADRLLAGGRLLAAGNGGSAAQAAHLAAELVGRFSTDRPAFSALTLGADGATVTALVNDYGVTEMFARQVDAHGQAGDVLVLLSTSGVSPNVLAAAERGRANGLRVWGLTGAAPNPLLARCHAGIAVAAGSTAAVQAVHLVAIHALCAAFDEQVRMALESGTPVWPRRRSAEVGA